MSTLVFRACGSCPSKDDPLDCDRVTCPTRTVSIARVEAATSMIAAHVFPWCRARVLHALGAAEEQGILEDVLAEILDDPIAVENARRYLRRHKWVSNG